MFEGHGDRHEGEVDGWRPLSLKIMGRWLCISSGLENIETCNARPWATTTCFRQGPESHVLAVDGLEKGRLSRGAILVCTKSGWCNPMHAIQAGVDDVLAYVAIAGPVLARNVCDLIDSQHCLLHVDNEGVRERVAVCTEWSMPEAIDVTIEDVGRRVTGLVAVSCRRPALPRGDSSGHEGLCGTSFWNGIEWHTIKSCYTLGVQVAFVDK